MPIDPLYEDTTSAYLTGQGNVQLPPEPKPQSSTGLGSVGLAVSLGAVQGAARLAGAAADLTSGASQILTDPSESLLNPQLQEETDRRLGETFRKQREGTLFTSAAGQRLYSLSDMLRPDPNNTTTTDQIVQGAVSSLTQIVPAAVLGGPVAGAAVGGTSIGLGRAEELKREGVDVGTRSAAGAVEGAFGAVGAVLPAGGSTIARTLGLVAVGGPGMAIAQAAAEKSILKNAGYDHLADQIDPLDPMNLKASLFVSGIFGAGHIGGIAMNARAARAADPATPLPTLDVAVRKQLPYDSPILSSYITSAAQREGVPPGLMLALIHAGEKSNSNQVSPKGAAGVAQMMPDNLKKFGVTDPKDPLQSIDGMARYLKATQDQYDGNVQAMIADYNGGPRQAAAVLRGERPPAAETAAYMDRVNDYLTNRVGDDLRFNPSPQEVDAALMARGQRIVDDAYVFGTPDDVNGMAAHQDAFELAARQMDEGGYPDVSRYFTPDDVTRANALEGLIADAESYRGDLASTAANLADPGAVAQARAELDQLRANAPDTSPESVKELTRQLQDQGAKYKAAAAEAQRRIDAAQADHEAQVARLEGMIRQNAEAQRASDQLPTLDSQIEQMRTARAGIDVPATRRTQIADFVSSLARAQREADRAPAVRRAEAAQRGADVTASSAEQTPSGASGVAAARAPSSADVLAAAVRDLTGAGEPAARPTSAVESNLREAAAATPDAQVEFDATAGEFRGSLRDALDTIDAEHAATMADAKLFEVAANCFIRTMG
ncbi:MULTISPECIES: lytic transglycosylase domain-containing protein [Burkholderia]|uniref:Transglycosylase n=1 Tax=Burkholderia contaminans TaxID=488447 RepID=A0A2S5DR18_9BURK|nr:MULTISPECIES: lytic transglycosylase domain-containing protein [Burkholderia]EKS9800323.1 transglycosylase SLT domain-containing protein [Burkholderia cepacia]EKS9807924.1 transglycosylase SLT domain-containing protein [Burkholderia cepacia]EKS9815524.1 transglycosylase SLT domain-containing protein [Burkholderia cepacia]EKS9823037.1 transglycosylase SLT domain-containing protein [Burkholderia cepacia]EKS9830627.1 transglycosylase SLT domain-containing protein [Burkholderia cepacia]